jgi:hypothetical protein
VLGLRVEGGSEVEALDGHAEDVLEGEVAFLDVHGDVGGDDYVVIAEVPHLAAAVAAEADGDEVHRAGLVEGLEDIGGVAGGGDAEEDVSGLAEGFDLTREDAIEAKVVAGSGKDRGVCGEGDGAEGGTVCGEADYKLGNEVLGVGGGASVAGDEEFAASLHGVGGDLGDGDDGIGDVKVGEGGLHGGDGLGQMFLNDVLHWNGAPGVVVVCWSTVFARVRDFFAMSMGGYLVREHFCVWKGWSGCGSGIAQEF